MNPTPPRCWSARMLDPDGLDPDCLDGAQRLLVDAIAGAPAAWCWLRPVKGKARQGMLKVERPWAKAGAVETWLDGLEAAGHRRETAEALEAAGWLAWWALPKRYPEGMTFSPSGAAALGLGLAELWAAERAPGGRREFSGEPVWRPLGFVEHHPLRLPPGGRLGVGLDWDLAGGDDPAEVAEADEMVRTAAGLVAYFEDHIAADPDGALQALHKAEALLEGVGEEVRKRWFFDPVTDLPKTIRGQLVPRDRRMRQGRAGPTAKAASKGGAMKQAG